jgi:hypothetical protein
MIASWAVVACLAVPVAAGAQDAASGSIVGVVRDSDGAVLPGVTVEAASPALIEKVRTVVTDGEGRYRVIDLRPGVYTVTFTLTGFRTFRREGIELTTGFAASVNAELSVGAFEETITVSGSAPVIDVSNTVQQLVVPREVQQALPLGKHSGIYVAMIPGASPNTGALGIDVGGTKGETQQNFVIHGSGGWVQLRDGMFYGLPLGGSNFLSAVNPATTYETTVQTVGGLSAEAQGAGVQVNYVPRDGGNVFSGSFAADMGHRRLQADNLDADLRARGATQPAAIRALYDVGGGMGGPFRQDRLWFFGSARYLETSNVAPGNWFNRQQGTLFYEPDLARPGYDKNYYSDYALRLTFQASRADKITFTQRVEYSCNCQAQVLTATPSAKSPEAAGDRYYWPYVTTQAGWTRVATNRLLVEGRGLILWGTVQQDHTDVGRGPNDPAVYDRIRNLYYGSPGTSLTQANARGSQDWASYQAYGAVSYVTGSHTFKAGTQLRKFALDNTFAITGDVTYNMAGRTPESITYWATPYINLSRIQQHAAYVQDQWSIRRLTLNLGLRYEYVHGYVPEQRMPAGPWVPERNFAAVKNVPRWTDLNSRVGAAYDLFGTGRTALKASIGRFQIVQANNNSTTQAGNPVNLMVTSATRTWNDANSDLVPQASELGPLSNALFGQLRAGTAYDPDLVTGFGVAPYSWQSMLALQHELVTGLGLNVAYFRTWYGNFQVTDNLLVGPGDYDEYCVTGPSHPNLPGGGNERICGILDLKPAKFGQVENFVTHASKYGDQSQVHNGVDVTLNARLGAAYVTGGFSVGRTVSDSCDVLRAVPEAVAQNTQVAGAFQTQSVANPAASPFQNTAAPQRVCRSSPPWSADTQLKLSGTYRLPVDFLVSANYQNVPAIPTFATYTVTNAVASAALGRNLSACRGTGVCTATANVELVAPNSLFLEERVNLVSVAVSRDFRTLGAAFRPRFELHNMLNSNAVNTITTRFGPQWQAVRGVLTPRLAKLAVQVEF